MSNAVIKIALTPGAALLASGLLGSTTTEQQAESTARTQIARGSYPFPVCHVAGSKQSRVVLVAEIERTLREMQQGNNQEPEVLPNDLPPRRGPGRPRKLAPTITHQEQRTPLASPCVAMISNLEDPSASHVRGTAVALAQRAREAGAKPPSLAQAGQPSQVDQDDSQDREQSESRRVSRPAAGGAASLREARSHAVPKAAAQGSARARERAEIARQRGDSTGSQPEHAAFRRSHEQAQEILTIDERSQGSQQDRTRRAATTDGRC